MPEGYNNPNFGDGSFPELITFYKSSGYKDQDLPKLMQGNRSRAPWKTREEMYSLYDAGDADILELQTFYITPLMYKLTSYGKDYKLLSLIW